MLLLNFYTFISVWKVFAYLLINILVKTQLVLSKLPGDADAIGTGSRFESLCPDGVRS